MRALPGGALRLARRAALAGLVARALTLSPAAWAQAQAFPVLSTSDFAGQTVMLGGDPDTVDWVKWGHPVAGGGDGPFSAQDLTAMATAFRQTRRSGGAAIGALAPVWPAGGSVSEPYWVYTRDGDARFLWGDGAPEATPPAAVQVRSGVALLPSGTRAHAGYGFQLTVAATPALQDLDLYIGCPNGGDPVNPPQTEATVEAVIDGAPRLAVAVCHDASKRAPKVTVTFASAPGTATPLSVAVTTDDQVLDATRSIVLLAAVLRAHPASPDAGASPDARDAGGAGGSVAGLADRPTACAVAGGQRADVATIGLLFVAAIAARRRRRLLPAVA